MRAYSSALMTISNNDSFKVQIRVCQVMRTKDPRYRNFCPYRTVMIDALLANLCVIMLGFIKWNFMVSVMTILSNNISFNFKHCHHFD